MTTFDVVDLIVYPELADGGDPVGLYAAGVIALEQKRTELAFSCFERSASSGYGKAACELGKLNRDGNTPNKRRSSKKALFWFKKAIELGYYNSYEELYNFYKSKGEVCRRELFNCLIDSYIKFHFFHPDEFLHQIREYYLIDERQLPQYFYYIKHLTIESMPDCMLYYEIAQAFINDSLDGRLSDDRVAFRLLQHAQEEYYKKIDPKTDDEMLVDAPNYSISRSSFFRLLGNSLSNCVEKKIGTQNGDIQQCFSNFAYITSSLAIQIIKLWRTDFSSVQEAILKNKCPKKFARVQGIIEKSRRIAWSLRELKVMARDGNFFASSFLLRLYYQDVLTHASDKMILEALTWSAQNGDNERQLELAECYRLGKYTAKDRDLAEKWYRRAAEVWYPRATAELFNVFLKEAEAGNIISSVYLGYDYENGFGVTTDFQQALYWYEMAGVNDCAPAMMRSARILYQLHKGSGDLPAMLIFRGESFKAGEAKCLAEANRLCDLIATKFGDAGAEYVTACRQVFDMSPKQKKKDNTFKILSNLLSDNRFFDVCDYVNRLKHEGTFALDSFPKKDRKTDDNPLNMTEWEEKVKKQSSVDIPHYADFTWIDKTYGSFIPEEEFGEVKKHRNPPQGCLNNAEIFVCAADYAEDQDPEHIIRLYRQNAIFHESDYVICGRPDGSIKGNVRYIIISNHMIKLKTKRSGFSNAYISAPDSYFMVWHTFTEGNIAVVILLHLNNEDWREYKNLVIDNSGDFIRNLKDGLFFYDGMPPDELLSSEHYIKHTSRMLLGFRG